MLGTPNLLLGGGSATLPAVLTFRPTKDVGKYAWEGSTPDQSLHFIAKSSPSETKTRYSYEIKQRINSSAAGLTLSNPRKDSEVRVFMVVEFDNDAAMNDTVVGAAIGYVAAAGTSALIRAASARGEV